MSHLVTEDPGIRFLGWAQFEARRLRACGVSKFKGKDAAEAAVFHKAYLESLGILHGRVVGERMQYRGPNSGIPVKDLLDLQLISGHIANAWVTPNEWKGSLSRDVEQNRVRKELDAEEMRVLLSVGKLTKTGFVHNSWSAVAIGLSVLGRINK